MKIFPTAKNSPEIPHIPWWLWANVLSLDAPIIAIIWQQMFAQTFGVHLSFPERAALFLAVWIVYASDRILDGIRLPIDPDTSARHKFAARHRVWGMAGIVLAGLTGVALVPFLPVRLLGAGFLFVVFTGLYFLWNQRKSARWGRGWLKEAAVGALFACGCALAPFVKSQSGFHTAIPIGLFALLCAANCLLISRLDRSRDLSRGEQSLAVNLPPNVRPARIVAILIVALDLVAFAGGLPLYFAASILLSAIGIWCGVYVESSLGRDVAAVWADFVLLSPLVLFWLPL